MSQLYFTVLRLPNFRLLLLTRMCIGIALQAQAVIVGWQVYSLTHDLFLLGLTGLIEAVPAILCALVAGHIVDVNHPRTTYLVCLGALTINTFVLLLVAGGFVVVPGSLLFWIFGGVFISGVARSFIMPSSFSLLARVVERKDLPSAAGWMSSGMQSAMMAGPALAGLIYGGYGPGVAWGIPVFTIAAAFMMMLFLKAPGNKPVPLEARLSAWESIREGWAFILKTPVLLSVMTLDMFAVLFGGAVAMLPAYADQVLHVGSEGLGLLRAAPAMGAVCMALVLAVRPMKKISAMRLLWVVTGFGICMIGFGLSEIFVLSMFFLALSGVFDSVSVVIRGTLMQWLTPDRMRGRVSAVNSMFIISSNEIGSFESGVAARYLGLVPSVVVGGIATLLVVGLVSMLSPQFRKTVIDTSKDA
jgi:MFS family permease